MGKPTLPNRKSPYTTIAEEQEAAQKLCEEKIKAHLQNLPYLLQKLSQIPDPRDPKKVKHQIAILMLKGTLIFLLHVPSRRQANRELTSPQLLENLKALYPELEDMPHQDTLNRFLKNTDVDQIEDTYISLLKKLIRKKKFRQLLHKKRYLVAIDGTQKHTFHRYTDERFLRRKTKEKDTHQYQYYSYVLEAVLILSNGMVLPLMSEFLENSPELEAIEKEEEWKQDCELKAFYRLAKRLKNTFPRLPITMLLDGLYANGPVIWICQKYKWDFMIVLKDKSLPTVWKEVKGLLSLDTKGKQRHKRRFKGRQQIFRWVNQIEYEYKPSNKKTKRYLNLHVVICEETWPGTDKEDNTVTKKSCHAWISSQKIDRENIHTRCNLMARKRWLHENNILKEKHQGYSYEHVFSTDWNAMKGYHYLMHIARLLNELALHSIYLIEYVAELGIRGFIERFRAYMTHRKLDQKRLRAAALSPGQLRLELEGRWQRVAA